MFWRVALGIFCIFFWQVTVRVLSDTQRMGSPVEAGDKQRVPAVELHMFPKNLSDINSTWQVLMVPRAKETCGLQIIGSIWRFGMFNDFS